MEVCARAAVRAGAHPQRLRHYIGATLAGVTFAAPRLRRRPTKTKRGAKLHIINKTARSHVTLIVT